MTSLRSIKRREQERRRATRFLELQRLRHAAWNLGVYSDVFASEMERGMKKLAATCEQLACNIKRIFAESRERPEGAS